MAFPKSGNIMLHLKIQANMIKLRRIQLYDTMRSQNRGHLKSAIKKLFGFLFYKAFEETFPVHKEKATLEAKKNMRKFYEVFRKKAVVELNQKEFRTLSDPDVQYVFGQALVESGRKDDDELRRNISSLLISRIKHHKSDLKKLVFGEAISTIGKLTADQVKIITACFVLEYATSSHVNNMADFNGFLENNVRPFLFFKNTHAEFMHIEYTRCGSLSVGSWDLIQRLRDDYSVLFMDGVDKSEFENFYLPDEIRKELITKEELSGKYLFTFKNLRDLEKYLITKSISIAKRKEIIEVYRSHILNNKLIEQKLRKETKLGNDLLQYHENTFLKHLTLTSVGIVIAATHFERVTGNKVDIDIWIN